VATQRKFRILNLLIPCLVPLALCLQLLASYGMPETRRQFFDWYSEAAFWFFCGPIPLIVDGASLTLLDFRTKVVLSIALRVLTIVPFVLYVPKDVKVAWIRLALNTTATIAAAVLGYLWLVLSGI
jgi:hypothetical protein